MKSNFRIFRGAVLIASLLVASCNNNIPVDQGPDLPRSTPEAEGVDSRGIIEFIKAADSSKHEFHSIMILRHGKVITEGWWSPYSLELKHTLYSTSKSFTSTAVGFAVTEKLLKVTDKVMSFFPEYLPDTVSPNLAAMEVKDLLSMSAGQDPDPTFLIPPSENDWIRAFLSRPVLNVPGTKFLYNSMATYMLSAIVQKVTGEKILDYLTPRLFAPLGIKGMDWETDPKGINTGGWGLRLKTEDMAKFGQLLLQKGKWKGKQIIPEEWINEATTFKIDQAPGVPDSIKQKSDWMQGYCYQFWRCRNNAFRGDGAYGQYIIVMPEQDAVVAITCETSDMQEELNLVWDYLLPSIKNEPLPANININAEYNKLLESLAVGLPERGLESKLIASVSGKKYQIDKNEMDIESLSFDFNNNQCILNIREEGKDYLLTFGASGWIQGSTSRKGPNLLYKARGYFEGIPPVSVAGVYRWRKGNVLELTLRYIESPHTERFLCTFKWGGVSVMRSFSNMAEPISPVLTGHVRN